MNVDKLRRVRSVRKWLEKAEKSYDSHEELSGELNLIMAQAEMQRLKETDRAGERRKTWLLRVAAMTAAVVLVSGGLSLRDRGAETLPAETLPVAATVSAEPPAAAPTVSVSAAPAAAPVAAVHAETERAPEPAAVSAVQAASEPVLSAQEIQSVVGEAGRALRGQP